MKRRATQRLDPNRLAQALSRPGNDPRTWVAFARVAEIVFDVEDGLTVAVDFTGGPLEGERDVPCLIAEPFARAAALGAAPFAVDDQAIVVLPEGDPNVFPVAVGFISMGTQPAPAEVNGTPITAEKLAADHVLVDPSKGLDWELSTIRMVASVLQLAAEAPTQPFVRGLDLVSSLNSLVAALNTYASALVTAPPATPVTGAQTGPAATALAASLTAFSNSLQATLSSKIVGE